MKKPEIYTYSSVERNEQGMPYIRVNLAGQEIELPMQFVKTMTEELLLAWVDAKREEITTCGAMVLAELLDEVMPSLIISPFSSKSIPMATHAVDLWNNKHATEVPLLVLYGGKDQELVKSQTGEDGLIHGYNPVTSSYHTKYVGLPSKYVSLIRQELARGNNIAILDDVYGTGATANAVRDIIRFSTQRNVANSQLPVLVVAREVEGEYKQQADESVLASIILPIIKISSE